MTTQLKLYNNLSWIWKLWGDINGEYAEFAGYIIAGIRKYSPAPPKTLLDVGCGGGKFVHTLKQHYRVTGIDISPDMLSQAQELNPECSFVQADMRDFKLNKQFDIVFVDDASAYLTTAEDLARLFMNCTAHLNKGGILIVTPDTTKETFVQNHTEVFHSTPHPQYPATEIVYIENLYDPDPEDTTIESRHIYLIRQNGKLTIENDLHVLGLFPLSTWERLLGELHLTIRKEHYTENGTQYTTFFCLKHSKA